MSGLPAGAPRSLAGGVQGYCVIVATTSYCWGNNAGGQLANGNTTTSKVAIASTLPAGKTVLGVGQFRCWQFTDRSVGCAGLNSSRQFGEATDARVLPINTSIGTTATGQPPLCATGAAKRADGTCSLSAGTTYCYRINYTLGTWTSPVSPVQGVATTA